MGTRRRTWLVGLAVLTMLMVDGTAALCTETTASGEGRSLQEAVNHAKRAAVEQVVGSLVKSQTQVTDGKLIWDRISSASTGYVRNYRVLSETKDAKSGFYRVELAVIVDDPKVQGAIDACIADPNCKQIFQEAFQRKVVVLYAVRTPFDLPYSSKGVQTVMDLIQDRLAHHQFRVFLPDQVTAIRASMAEKIADEKAAIDLVRSEKGDVAVVVSYDADIKNTEDGYRLVLCSLSAKAYDLHSGQFFATVQNRGKSITREGQYSIEDAAARVAIQIGPQTADDLTKKMMERFRPSSILVLRNASAETQRAAMEIVEKAGWRYRMSLQSGTYLEMEIFTDTDATTLRTTLDREFMNAMLPLAPAGMAGSRIEFEGKAQNGQ